MKKIVTTAMLLTLLFVVACGGKKAEPVMVKRIGDENKNCKILAYDIENIEFKIYKLLPETKGKTLKNVGYGVAGFYTFFIPWLLIDFSNAEAKEYEALRARHDHLAQIAKGKNCQITVEKYPSLDDVKKDYEIFKKTGPKREEEIPEDTSKATGGVTSQNIMTGKPQPLIEERTVTKKPKPYDHLITYGRPTNK